MAPRRYRITCKYNGVCSCGASIYEGDDILYDADRRAVIGCAFCDWRGLPQADTSAIRGGMRGVMAGVRRRQERERRRRAREDTE